MRSIYPASGNAAKRIELKQNIFACNAKFYLWFMRKTYSSSRFFAAFAESSHEVDSLEPVLATLQKEDSTIRNNDLEEIRGSINFSGGLQTEESRTFTNGDPAENG